MHLAGVEPTKYPTSELIRRKNAGEPLEDEEDKDALPRGKANWIGKETLTCLAFSSTLVIFIWDRR